MLEQLEQIIDDIGDIHSKLVLLIGPPHAGKTTLLRSLAKRRDVTPLNVGAELGRRLAGMPQRQRHFQTTTILRELADQRRRPVCTVLTERRDSCYAASAERSVVFAVIRGKSAATFHGRSSAILLMRCSLMWMITYRKYASGSSPLSLAVPIKL